MSVIEHPFAATTLSIVIEPSFSAKRSVYYQEIYVDGEQQHVIGGAIVQDTTSEPQTWQRHLSHAEAKKIRRLLMNVNVSLEFESPEYVLDGTSWTFGIRSGKSCIQLEWWNDLPANWSSLKIVIDTVLAMAREKEPPKWWEFWRI